MNQLSNASGWATPALAAALYLAGCSQSPPSSTKIIEVPDGGEPVLTTAEINALPARPKRLEVAQASFQRPVAPQPVGPRIKPFDQWTEQDVAADALGRIGTPAVPALIEVLQNADPEARLKAIEVLGRMGDDAKDAVPELTRLLDDPDPRVRKAAARTVGHIGPAAQDAVPALMQTLLNPKVSAEPQP
jgi:HEAT repeat protein